MRVIAGEFRSRQLISVEGTDTRPTSDRLRETLFNILGPRVEGSVFVDAYAGTGAVGIEALSRGARKAIFVEKDRGAIEVIRMNLASLKLAAKAKVIKGNVPTHLSIPVAGLEADFVFLDPPYLREGEYRASLESLEPRSLSPSCMQPSALIVIQHSTRFKPADKYGRLQRVRYLRQGENALSFFSRFP